MGTPSLVSSLLRWQVETWKPYPFDYSIDPDEFAVTVREEFPDYENNTIRKASERFRRQFLKIQPLQGSAVLNERAIRTAKTEGVSICFSSAEQNRLRKVLYRRFRDTNRPDRISRETLRDALDSNRDSIAQNLYVLWLSGEIEVTVSESKPVIFRSVAMTDFGRKPISNSHQP